ncbi:putative glycosyl transferase [Alphaentomopoxvirus acuprea]|uniref:Putative glycosyl transferase n=1 Tax=Alphaentomopoxvirus acuprea TaxID=62099 RepID=W6JIU6_9POXV|nr:putative glycosyl transferase [Anomala cuprea entomopoxvirus]BAO49472.1 putative glycosyl transferase [Anomala cuprea entomopoxvirus]
MNYLIIVLTIHRNTERQSNLKKILHKQNLNENVDYIMYYGIDYKNTDKNKLLNICKSGFKGICPYSILACASSHILLWNYISRLTYDYIIVLEDDTYINIKKYKDIKNVIEKYINNNILFLYSDYYYLPKNKYKFNNNCTIIHSPVFHVSMGCYIITPNVSKILFEYYIKNKIWFHIDFQMNFDLKYLKIDRYIFMVNELCNQYYGNKSSMGIKHASLFLNKINDTKLHRIVTTPILRIYNIEFDLYVLLLILFLLLMLILYNTISILFIITIFFIIYELYYSII